MILHKFSFGTIALNRIGIAILANTVLSTSALNAAPAPISFEVEDRNGVLGKVDIEVGRLEFDDDPNFFFEGIEGAFEVTRKNANGDIMTVKELEESLGGLRFNWLQIVTYDTDPKNDPNGNPLIVPYIDPPKDGYEDLWADDRP